MTTRRSLLVTLVLLLVFAGLVLLGGSVNVAYSHSRDYVSSLASRGTEHAWIGMLALGSFAAAHVAVAVSWRQRGRLVWILLVVCASLLLTVALARASCPSGAASCQLSGSSTETDTGDSIHGIAVGIYALMYLVAAVSAGAVLWRRRSWLPGLAALGVAVLSVLALGRIDEASPGAEQRIWLTINGLGLLAITGLAAVVPQRSGRKGQAGSA